MKPNARYIPIDPYNRFVVYAVTPDPKDKLYPELFARIGKYPTLVDAQAGGEKFKDQYPNQVIVEVRAVSVKPSFWEEYK